MATAAGEIIEKHTEAVVRAVRRAAKRSSGAELETLRAQVRQTLDALHRTLEELDARQARTSASLERVELPAERRRAYFPATVSPRRVVSQEDVERADAGWEAARERGRRYRDEALRQVGPVLSPREVAGRLGVSAVTVNNWRRQDKLLAFRFDDHRYLYPAFQFVESPAEGERGVLRHLNEVLARLPYRSDWAKARFFVTSFPALGGSTPLEALRSGDEQEAARVLDLAGQVGDMGAA